MVLHVRLRLPCPLRTLSGEVVTLAGGERSSPTECAASLYLEGRPPAMNAAGRAAGGPPRPQRPFRTGAPRESTRGTGTPAGQGHTKGDTADQADTVTPLRGAAAGPTSSPHTCTHTPRSRGPRRRTCSTSYGVLHSSSQWRDTLGAPPAQSPVAAAPRERSALRPRAPPWDWPAVGSFTPSMRGKFRAPLGRGPAVPWRTQWNAPPVKDAQRHAQWKGEGPHRPSPTQSAFPPRSSSFSRSDG